jgi:hypothetical protein
MDARFRGFCSDFWIINGLLFVMKQNGTIELTFTVTKGDLAGKTVVVFETLYVEDKEVGAHTENKIIVRDNIF